MKTSFRFLSLLLCLELFVGQFGHTIILDSVALAQTPSCSAGTTYNSGTNRCEVNKSVVETKQALDRCSSMADEAQRKECYLQSPKDGLSGSPERNNTFMNEKGGSTFLGGATAAAGIAVPLFFLIKVMKERGLKSCKPNSLVLLYAGGAALVVQEVVSFIQHKASIKKLEDMKEALTAKQEGNADKIHAQATETQSKAFELMAENEKSLGKVAKTKFIGYLTATGLFAAGAVMATLETFQVKKAKLNRDNAYKARATAFSKGAAGASEVANQTAIINRNIATINKLECPKTKEADKEADKYATKDALGTTPGDASVNNANSGTIPKENTGDKTLNKINSAAGIAGQAAGLIPKKKEEKEIQKKEPVSCDAVFVEDYCKPEDGCKWDGEHCKYSNSVFMNLPLGSPRVKTIEQLYSHEYPAELIEISNKRVKRAALVNIGFAKSFNDLQNLLAEIESLDFSRDSKQSYLDDQPFQLTFGNDIPFTALTAKLVSNVLLGEDAHAVYFDPKSIIPASNPRVAHEALGHSEILIQTQAKIDKKEGALSAFKAKAKKIIDDATYKPKGRAITNALLGGWMGIMSSHMKKQMDISNERADKLITMRDEFKSHDAINSCKEADRANAGKPECYCMTPENTPNPSRKNSKVCAQVFGYYKASSTNYLASTQKICVDSNAAIDASCSCKAKGTCLRTATQFQMNGMNAGTFKMLSSSVAPSNDIFNGNSSSGTFDMNGLGANAMRSKAVIDSILKSDPELNKETSNLGKDILASSAGLSMGSGTSSPPISGITPQQAAAAIDKEIESAKESDAINLSVSDDAGGSGTAVVAEPQPEFGLTEEGAAIQEDQIAEVMKEDMDFGANEINAGSNVNIFEVVSDRYKRSGMRRLFDAEGKTQADPAAKKEIHD